MVSESSVCAWKVGKRYKHHGGWTQWRKATLSCHGSQKQRDGGGVVVVGEPSAKMHLLNHVPSDPHLPTSPHLLTEHPWLNLLMSVDSHIQLPSKNLTSKA